MPSRPRQSETPDPATPGARTLAFFCDGTLSTLRPGRETNVGHAFNLLKWLGPREDLRICYDKGIQGRGWRKWLNAASGLGLNASIRRGYTFLSQEYRPGDWIILLGYSRGAYAVRSLAGLIGQIGLLRPEYTSERAVLLAFRY